MTKPFQLDSHSARNDAFTSRCRILRRGATRLLGHPGYRSVLNRLALVLALGIMSGNTFAGKVSLAWNASAGATGYRLFYGTASRNYTALVNTKAARSYTLYGLTAGRRYYFAVRAYNASKVSAYSTEISTIVR
jgi:hypothetical protein